MHSSQDQNFLSLHLDGVKTNVEKNTGGRKKKRGEEEKKSIKKKTGGGGKGKALNDISNAIPIGEVSKNIAGKERALGDPFEEKGKQQTLKKRGQEKKSTSVAEEDSDPGSITEDCFLHNHDECVKSLFRSHEVLDVTPPLSPCYDLSRKKEEPKKFSFRSLRKSMDEDFFGIWNSPGQPVMDSDEDEIPWFILKESPKQSE